MLHLLKKYFPIIKKDGQSLDVDAGHELRQTNYVHWWDIASGYNER